MALLDEGDSRMTSDVARPSGEQDVHTVINAITARLASEWVPQGMLT